MRRQDAPFNSSGKDVLNQTLKMALYTLFLIVTRYHLPRYIPSTPKTIATMDLLLLPFRRRLRAPGTNGPDILNRSFLLSTTMLPLSRLSMPALDRVTLLLSSWGN